jgi:hypothetical protein
MKKKLSKRFLFFCITLTIISCAFLQTSIAADKTYKISFSTGHTASVAAGDDFVFAITCQPPTDITEIKASNGTLTAEKTIQGGPSTPQGVIKGLWTLSEISGDVTITLTLNTQEGADLPTIITDKKAAEDAINSAGAMGGPGGGAPPGGAPGDAPPAGAPGGAPPTGATGGAPPS